MRGLLGVAILVRGAVVRGPVVLEVLCLEQGLPMRGFEAVALELVHSLGEGLDGWGGGRFGFQLLEKCCCLLGRLPVQYGQRVRPRSPICRGCSDGGRGESKAS